MMDYVLHLPEEEGVTLSGPVVRRLIQGGNGDAALLYIALLQNRGSADDEKIRSLLRWDRERLGRALDALAGQSLISMQGQREKTVRAPEPPAHDRRPEYTRADVARSLEGAEFAALTRAVEEKLGKKLNMPDLMILLGLYDQLGLPSDVIFLLVGFCAERTAQRFGEGRMPTLRQIEKEGYVWARLGLMTQESAAAYIRKDQQSRQALPRLARLLGLGDRKLSESEEKYLLKWSEMGFQDEAVALAYDKTALHCGKLEWRYMNGILRKWHEKGLHTLEQVQTGDGRQLAGRKSPAPAQEDEASVREDMARMAKFYQQLNREKEEE